MTELRVESLVHVFEGGVRHYGHEPDVRVRKLAPGRNDLLVRWR